MWWEGEGVGEVRIGGITGRGKVGVWGVVV